MKSCKSQLLRNIAWLLLASMLLSFAGCGMFPGEPTEPTEPPATEVPTEKPTEMPTERPTEEPTEKPTEAPTEKPTEAPTEKPTEPSGDAKIVGHKVSGSYEMSRVWEDGTDDIKVGPQLSYDGQTGTYWNPKVMTGYTGDPAITYELGKGYDLNKFVFTFSATVYFKLFVSADDKDYAMVAQIDANNAEKAFNYGVCTLEGLKLEDIQFVKLVFTGNAAGSVWISFIEAEMTEEGRTDLDTSWMLPEEEPEEEEGEEVITISKAIITDYELVGEFVNDRLSTPSYGPMKAYDGDVNTYWNPCAKGLYSGTPGIIFKLDKAYDLNQLVLTFGDNHIMYMDISVSADGTSYIPLISVTKEDTSMYNGGVATIDASTATGVQYIKVVFTGRNVNNDWITFKEIAVTAKTVKKITMKVSGAFSSNMVLQRGKPITVWGWGKAGADVTGTFGGHTATATIDENGKWELIFPQQTANTNGQTMTISGMNKTITFDNILIGDVYLVSGQSNAELSVGRTVAHLDAEAKQVVYDLLRQDPNIRIFHQAKSDVVNNPALWDAPQDNVINSKYSWKIASSNDNFWNFSALGMHFAKTLRENLNEDVPIGLIQMAAGGAYLSELLPGELCEQFQYSTKQTVTPGAYYNTMINPFVGLPISGMLYYQGESYHAIHVNKYAEELAAFITELRTRWGQKFNFYNVQLSTYGQMQVDQKAWPLLPDIRDQQYKVLSMVDNYYLTTSMDVGYRGEVDVGTNVADWAHPKDKKTLGERIALQALAVYYGQLEAGEKSFSPVPADVQWNRDGILISFKNADTLKLAVGDVLVGFQCVINAEVVNVTGQIVNGNQVLLPVDATTVAEVRYGLFQLGYAENANLTNGAGLPAPTFTLKNPGEFTTNKIIINGYDLPATGWTTHINLVNPLHAIDGNLETHWNTQIAAFSAKPEITYYFNAKADLDGLKMTFNSRKMYMTVYVSTNDADYTEVAKITSANYADFYEGNVCTISGLNAKSITSIKLVFNGSSDGGTWIDLYEVEPSAKPTVIA